MNGVCPELEKFYFLFAPSSPFAKGFMTVLAPNEIAARQIMIDIYGSPIWVLSYTEEAFEHVQANATAKGFERYEIPLGYIPEFF